MSQMAMSSIAAIILTGTTNPGLPARATWPIHDAVSWLSAEAVRVGAVLPFDAEVMADPDVMKAVAGLDATLGQLQARGLLRVEGAGYTAVLRVQPDLVPQARRFLLRLEPVLARLVDQACHRFEAAASTAVKNAALAAESWASSTTSATPTVRHPELVRVR